MPKIRTAEEKTALVKEWLSQHNAETVGSIVYDDTAVVTTISATEIMGFYIEVRPLKTNINIGAGLGQTLLIDFNK